MIIIEKPGYFLLLFYFDWSAMIIIEKPGYFLLFFLLRMECNDNYRETWIFFTLFLL